MRAWYRTEPEDQKRLGLRITNISVKYQMELEGDYRELHSCYGAVPKMTVEKDKQGHSELIGMLRELKIIHDERVSGASGLELPFYVDIKKAYGIRSIRQKIASEIWQLMERKPSCIAASGYGGVPLATTISDLYGVKLSLVRDTPKDHGLGGLIRRVSARNQ